MIHFKPLARHTAFDKIVIWTEPRHKSGLSGDEWRHHVNLELWQKGVLVYTRSYSRQEWAINHLPWLLTTLPEIDEGEFTPEGKEAQRRHGLYGEDGSTCMQPGCKRESTVFLRLKSEFSEDGHVGPMEPSPVAYRAFCLQHADRGDCSREDNNDNYERVPDPRRSP